MQNVTELKLADFDFELPEDLIAQTPVSERDQSRLMVLDRRTGDVRHRIFREITGLLRAGDLLVVNDTRVFPCRLPVRKQGGGKAELFLLEELGLNRWRAMIRGGIGAGMVVQVAPGIEARVLSVQEDGTRELQFLGTADIRASLPEIGKVPLPPYIRREPGDADRERYQTVYAAHDGAVAAPTAGLHFTGPLLAEIREKGIETVPVTLHVGPGTFQPVRTEALTDHRMHPERYQVSEASAEAINRAKAEGRRVIAVGTTSVRTLESAAGTDGNVRAGSGESSLFIFPGYAFRIVDGIITNFHLPKSTLLMLVAAFAGLDRMREAYRIAVAERYRFYSYGDAMLLI